MSRKVLGIDIRKESVSAVLVKTSLRENRMKTGSMPMRTYRFPKLPRTIIFSGQP